MFHTFPFGFRTFSPVKGLLFVFDLFYVFSEKTNLIESTVLAAPSGVIENKMLLVSLNSKLQCLHLVDVHELWDQCGGFSLLVKNMHYSFLLQKSDTWAACIPERSGERARSISSEIFALIKTSFFFLVWRLAVASKESIPQDSPWTKSRRETKLRMCSSMWSF